MSLSDTTLVCEGEIEGRDVRWLGLVIDRLGLSASVDVQPCGSKGNMKPTVEGLRRALRSPRVYGIRDRDFLRTEHLEKDRAAGVVPLRRHSLESYLAEPSLIENATGAAGVGEMVTELAETRIYSDAATAALEEFAFGLRNARPRAGKEIPLSRDDAVELVTKKLTDFVHDLVCPNAAELVDRALADMRRDELWARVHGKDLLTALEHRLRSSLPGGDLEGRLFRWCAEHEPPQALVEDVKRALMTLGAIPVSAP